jgi:hypothetical protein
VDGFRLVTGGLIWSVQFKLFHMFIYVKYFEYLPDK